MGGENAAGLHKRRVLIIDDSRAFLAMASRQLIGRGYDVTTAEGGFSGLETFFDSKLDPAGGFDVVITDLTMPEFNGLAVLANIRARYPETPVILLSSEGDMTTVRKALREGAFDYIIKTEGVEALNAGVERAFERIDAEREQYRRTADPLKTLASLAQEGAQGELIVATEDAEVHAFLQNGRIAWATSSKARQPFTRYLIEKFAMDPDVIKVVVDECRKTGVNVGEALVRNNVATLEQVREALRNQLLAAISTIPQLANAKTMFLPRKVQYSESLIFDAQEVLPS